MTPLPLSVGVDLVEIPRIRRALERWGERFLKRVYTPAEIARCRGRVPELAVRFAAKEAVSKALGIGIWWPGGIAWHEAEVLSDSLGKPEIVLHGRAAERARDLGLDRWAVSLSHSDDNAIAMVVAMHHN
jgi:holo-[acyl-carrier protein] synthase